MYFGRIEKKIIHICSQSVNQFR